MQLSDFHFDLPAELIAQEPLSHRDASRMLVLRRDKPFDGQPFERLPAASTGPSSEDSAHFVEDSSISTLPERLAPGDCLILNNTRVFPSRLLGHRGGLRALPVGKHNPARHEHLQGTAEVFLTRQHPDDPLLWQALVRPGRKLPVGEQVYFAEDFLAEIVDRGEFGERTVRFHCPADMLMSLIEQHGHVPLPPYIHRADADTDRARYQTVYANEKVASPTLGPGSVAAPTAGLHFTPELLGRCRDAGAEIAEVTLHVGLGTFQPLRNQQVEANELHAERYAVTQEAAERINRARRRIAVGTTAVRTLESAAVDGRVQPGESETRIFIYPGYHFQAVDALLTNFHLPESSLLMLVSAFAGTDRVLAAYRHAVASQYRFFSYGDCMFIP
jgi:S-adenosylmethionine:tRNA ribosyltransferase-isomerase